MITLSDLPYEIILCIFDYLNICDKIAFLTVYPKFSNKNSKQFRPSINLGRQFHLHNFPNICEHFSQIIDFSYIKVFNINSLYWIPEQSLLKCISKMTNLRTLLALDTELDLAESHCEIYKRLPLENVSLTLHFQTYRKEVFLALPNVKKLCLKYGHHVQLVHSLPLNLYTSIIQEMEELVLIDSGHILKLPSDFVMLGLALKCRRFIFKSLLEIDLERFSYLLNSVKERGYLIYYNNDRGYKIRNNVYHELICYKSNENHCDQIKLFPHSEKYFNIFPIKDNENGAFIVRCLDGSSSFGNINISEMLETLPNLFKIQVPSCFLIHMDQIDGIENYFKHLQEFQVIGCCCVNTVPKYEVIGKFKNLRRLSIQIIHSEDTLQEQPSYLENILKNCQYLEFLQIRHFKYPMLSHRYRDAVENANMALINNLKHARNLKEFSFYACFELFIDPLIEALNNTDAKLERIYLEAYQVTGVQDINETTKQIDRYIVNNPQLLLFIIQLVNNEFGIKSFENKKYINSVTNIISLPNHIRIVHADLVYCVIHSGFDPFV